MRHSWASLVAGAAGVLLVMAATPAGAAEKSWYDETGETNNSGLMDIGKVTVVNTKSKVIARFHVPEFDGVYPAGSTELYLDTDPKKSGPEFLYVVGFPGESAFFTIKNWKVNKTWFSVAGEGKCGRAVRTRFDLDQGLVSFSIVPKKGCSGKPKRVRAYVHTLVTGEYSEDDYSDWVDYDARESDYYPAKKKFSAWVTR